MFFVEPRVIWMKGYSSADSMESGAMSEETRFPRGQHPEVSIMTEKSYLATVARSFWRNWWKSTERLMSLSMTWMLVMALVPDSPLNL